MTPITTARLREMIEAAERWKDIPGYEGRYQASTTGRIRSLMYINRRASFVRQEPLVLKQVKRPNGYMYAQLSGRTPLAAHRAVLMAFVGPCPEGMECAHLNAIRDDNRIENLEWQTKEQNQSTVRHVNGSDLWSAKLCEDDVKKIILSYAERRPVKDTGWYKETMSRYGIARGTLAKIVSGTTWKSVHKKIEAGLL